MATTVNGPLVLNDCPRVLRLRPCVAFSYNVALLYGCVNSTTIGPAACLRCACNQSTLILSVVVGTANCTASITTTSTNAAWLIPGSHCESITVSVPTRITAKSVASFAQEGSHVPNTDSRGATSSRGGHIFRIKGVSQVYVTGHICTMKMALLVLCHKEVFTYSIVS